MSPAPVITMGYWCAVASILAFAAVALASVGDNALDGGERVVLVSPVLAPPRDSGANNGALRARQFPVLVLLSRQSRPDNVREHDAKSLDRNPRPIYVKVIIKYFYLSNIAIIPYIKLV